LARAQAAYDRLRAGASAAEIARAEAAVRAAQAQLKQAAGGITPADETAAAAEIQRARAHLAALQAGPESTELKAAQAQLAQMQANLQAQRDALSTAKTNAELQVERAASDLTRAQANYATALQNWQYVEDTNRDPITPWLGTDSKGQKIPNTLDEAQRQQYYNAYVQAEAALRSTETSVKQAQLAYAAARQAEISGIQIAEQMVASSQIALEKVRAGGTAEELAAARAEIASGQAMLERMGGEQRAGTLEAAQAAVDQAQAGLEQLRAGASPNDLAVAAAEVEHAQAALKLAQATLAETELRAPFAGTIAAIDVRVGEYSMLGTPVMQLANLSAWQLETTDLTERTVVRVHEGSQASIRFDALPDLELGGVVRSIKPLGASQQGDITYTAIIILEQQDPRLRWNMTASVIVDEER
jgi:HlyD family secretion protein